MINEIYRRLCETMSKRGGECPAMDIPEFYSLTEELFTPEEAEVFLAIPRGYHPANAIADVLGKPTEEVEPILEGMAEKGLCVSGNMGDTVFYGSLPFLPGIFEFQFMRGSTTEKDKRLARLIRDYKMAVAVVKKPSPVKFPTTRVIPVNRTIDAEITPHTYDQAASYITKYDPIAVSTCYCRHEAKLIDQNDDCGKPDGVCMQFGMVAQFVIDRGIGRQITNDEALNILEQCEKEGLVHSTINRQEIEWLCNCCKDHCTILKKAFSHPKPALVLNSGFQPVRDMASCKSCGICIERCPASALAMDEDTKTTADLDRCIGCGVCASGCPEDAITLIERAGSQPPPFDQKALKEAIKTSNASG